MLDHAIAQRIANILDDKKANNIIALNVSGMTVVCEYMVIASGRSVPHVKALYDAVYEELNEQLSLTPRRSEGVNEGHWIVMDYGGIVVHIFHPEERAYYNLERLWSDGQNQLTLVFDAPENSDDR